MKAIELLKEYKSIDFGCDVEELHNKINEAIKELEAHMTVYQVIRNRLDKKTMALAELQDENETLKQIIKNLSVKNEKY